MTKLDFHHFQIRHFNNVFEQSYTAFTQAQKAGWLTLTRIGLLTKLPCECAQNRAEPCRISSLSTSEPAWGLVQASMARVAV